LQSIKGKSVKTYKDLAALNKGLTGDGKIKAIMLQATNIMRAVYGDQLFQRTFAHIGAWSGADVQSSHFDGPVNVKSFQKVAAEASANTALRQLALAQLDKERAEQELRARRKPARDERLADHRVDARALQGLSSSSP